MHAVAGDFANGPQTRHSGAPIQISSQSSHMKMCGRGHRHGLQTRVDTVRKTTGQDGRKPLRPCITQMLGMQESIAAFRQNFPDHTCDQIAWCKICHRMASRHEGSTVFIAKNSASTAQRFRQQRQLKIRAECQSRWMELDELEITHCCTRRKTQSQTDTLGTGRIAGRRKQGSQSTGCQHDIIGFVNFGIACFVFCAYTGNGITAQEQGIDIGFGMPVNMARLFYLADQGLHECTTTGIATGMGDAGKFMAAFACQVKIVALSIEQHALIT